MKKLLLFLCLALVSTGAFAQASFSIKAGFSMTNFISDENAQAKPGFKIGVGSDIILSDILYLQPSLMVAGKGAQYSKGTAGLVTAGATVNSLYLELPVLIGAKVWLGGNTRLNIGVGPYIAYGIGGTTVHDGSLGGINYADGGLPTFGKDVNMNPFDAGLALAAGFEFGNFLVGLDTQMGLTKLSANSVWVSKNAKNMTATLYVGFKF